VTIGRKARRGFGKSLVAIGLFCSVGLAIATPLAFTAQVATPLQLLLLAALAVAICFALILAGDLLADFSKRKTRSSADLGDLPKGREARDRRIRASDAQPQPAPAAASSSRTRL
jgi:hypothetical protein